MTIGEMRLSLSLTTYRQFFIDIASLSAYNYFSDNVINRVNLSFDNHHSRGFMFADEHLLHKFELGLNPQRLEASAIPATIIGYGEISAIFQIAEYPGAAFKRLPLFSDRPSAEKYARQFHEYCHLLARSGLHLPEHQTFIIEPPDRPVAV